MSCRGGRYAKDDNHRGPTLFYNAGESDQDQGEKEGDAEEKAAGAPPMELSLNVGVQFWVTDATSDTGLKFQGSIGF